MKWLSREICPENGDSSVIPVHFTYYLDPLGVTPRGASLYSRLVYYFISLLLFCCVSPCNENCTFLSEICSLFMCTTDQHICWFTEAAYVCAHFEDSSRCVDNLPELSLPGDVDCGKTHVVVLFPDAGEGNMLGLKDKKS